MTNAFEVGLERYERERKKDMVEEIADSLVQDHVEMLREIAALRAEVATLTAALDAKIDVQCDEAVLALKDECEDHRQQLIKEQLTAQQLHDICRDAYEVWAGSEGIPEPTTCSEAYLYQLLTQMRDEVKRGLK